jgi:hypothetical protein
MAMKSITNMKSKIWRSDLVIARFAAWAVALSVVLVIGIASQAGAQTQGARTFATAEEAADAFISAAETFDEAALAEILGPGSYDLIHSGEPVADRQIATEFAKLGREKKTLVPDKRNRNLMLLSVGADDWPSPIPIVRKGGKWFLDAAAGRQELLYRRVGRNELDAIKFCRGYVEAQHDYALEKHDGAPVNQYAQHIIATPGKQDGLAWLNADGTWGGPVGENAAKAIASGYTDKTTPYHGYYYKVLKGQGPAAPLGALDYMVKGYMIGGFALIAYPSQYQVTGVKTFIVSQDGVVYEKDLGPNTVEIAKGIEVFDPDKTWTPVFDDDE